VLNYLRDEDEDFEEDYTENELQALELEFAFFGLHLPRKKASVVPPIAPSSAPVGPEALPSLPTAGLPALETNNSAPQSAGESNSPKPTEVKLEPTTCTPRLLGTTTEKIQKKVKSTSLESKAPIITASKPRKRRDSLDSQGPTQTANSQSPASETGTSPLPESSTNLNKRVRRAKDWACEWDLSTKQKKMRAKGKSKHDQVD